MCGLCGEIQYGNDTVNGASIQAMTAKMRARGPDAGGIFVQDGLGFGHRRLSILDLSPASQQPLVDPELGLGIAFNGCIYNFRELRQELTGRGYRFFSQGDTEVILKAYHAWGPRCVERFFGMFAFAIWERDSGRVVLARDRLGIKPLYWSDNGKAFRFASTLPALLAAGDIDTSIDEQALHHYMSFHAVVPAPMTILKGVRKLAPATILTIEPDGSRREEVYWKLDVRTSDEDRRLSEQDWKEMLVAELGRAVERRTVADVPTGVLLSGGLDSSLVVALLARQGASGIKTFSIGFDAVGDQSGDEFVYSDLVARHFGTEHQQIRIDADRALGAISGVVAAMSEPMMSHDAIGFYLLGEEVSRHVRVVQSGQGADEIFGGYHWHQPMLQSNCALSDYSRLYFDRDHAEMSEALAPSRLGEDYSREFVSDYFARCRSDQPADKVLQIDSEIMLVDDPVKRVDNMTMAWGLEARVPFLDHSVVELAARIPAELKVRSGGKHILKAASRGLVPDEIIDRPKGYFPVPAFKRLRGPYLDLVRDALNNPRARQRDLFNRAYIDRLLDNPERELTPKGHSKLWQVGLLELWLQNHGI
jgi:asparagine synthase (glutamine-hydrolysing)